MGINDNLVLHINGIILDCDSKILDDYDIDDGKIIAVAIQGRDGIIKYY